MKKKKTGNWVLFVRLKWKKSGNERRVRRRKQQWLPLLMVEREKREEED